MPKIIRNIRGFTASHNTITKRELEKSKDEVIFTKEDREFLDYLKEYHANLSKDKD